MRYLFGGEARAKRCNGAKPENSCAKDLPAATTCPLETGLLQNGCNAAPYAEKNSRKSDGVMGEVCAWLKGKTLF
jgi:hypothetical protein